MLIEEKIKYRVVGLIVIIALLVIIIPLFVNHLDAESNQEITISEPPQPTNAMKAMKSQEAIDFQPTEIAQVDLSTNSVKQEPAGEVKLEQKNQQQVEVANNEVVKESSSVSVNSEIKESLPKKTTQVIKDKPIVASKNEAKNNQEWLVQLGSFSTKKNADQLAESLKKIGYNIVTKNEKTGAGKDVFRVLLRSALPRKQLEIVLTKLEKSYKFKSAPIRSETKKG